MKRLVMVHALFICLIFISCTFSIEAQHLPVTFTEVKERQQVEVYLGGELFTAYRYSNGLEKPVLFPVMAKGGIPVTRGFPIEPRPGEKTDHPHHVGMWFNYGDVNGIDFWNNSYAVPEHEKHKFGSIRHRNIIRMDTADGRGLLIVRADWVDHKNKVLMTEETEFRFYALDGLRVIQRKTKLKARAPKIVFGDSKEGLMAIRVDRAFEEPMTEPEILIGQDGKPGSTQTINNEGVTGRYRNDQGMEGGDAWGKRASWVKLSTIKDGQFITMAFVDHWKNPGVPSFWHARGYGLFSVNNLGANAYDAGVEKKVTTLSKNQELVFRHMFVVGPTQDLTDADMERLLHIHGLW